MNSLETFQADCISWSGYKPCPIQVAENRPDCNGCEQYQPGNAVYEPDYQPLDADMLRNMGSVGIVEMGGLGSILRTTAVTRAVREVNPDVQIDWFTYEYGTRLLEYVPGVTAVDVAKLDDPTVLEDAVSRLDALINFESNGNGKDVILNAKVIGGFAINAQGKFHAANASAAYLQRLQVDDKFRAANQLNTQQILVGALGLDARNVNYDIALRPDNYQRAGHVLDRAFGLERPARMVGLNIGTSENGKVRRWPAEYHAALAQRLAAQYPDIGIAILSGPEDTEVRDKVAGKLEAVSNLAVLPNNLEIGDFIAVISNMSVVVSSNTFGLHAAKSQGVQVVTFDNPIPPQEMELDIHDALLGPKLSCGPCFNRCSRTILGECMTLVGVDEVASHVEKVFIRPKQKALRPAV